MELILRLVEAVRRQMAEAEGPAERARLRASARAVLEQRLVGEGLSALTLRAALAELDKRLEAVEAALGAGEHPPAAPVTPVAPEPVRAGGELDDVVPEGLFGRAPGARAPQVHGGETLGSQRLLPAQPPPRRSMAGRVASVVLLLGALLLVSAALAWWFVPWDGVRWERLGLPLG